VGFELLPTYNLTKAYFHVKIVYIVLFNPREPFTYKQKMMKHKKI